MKEFNLERAKAGDPVQTRAGLPARIVCFDRKLTEGDRYNLVVLVDVGHCEEAYYVDEAGNELRSGNAYSLKMKTKIVTRWYNLYKNGPGNFFVSEEEAKEGCRSSPSEYLETRSIEFEE